MSDVEAEEGSGFEFGISAAIDVVMGLGASVNGMTKSTRDLLAYLRRSEPVIDRRAADGIVDSDGDPLLLDIGTPIQGTFWEVRKVMVGGLDVAAFSDDAWGALTVDGFAGLYVSGAISEIALKNPGNGVNLQDFAPSLPSVGYYPSGAFDVKANEHVYVVVYGGTVGQQYVANANIRIFNTAYPDPSE